MQTGDEKYRVTIEVDTKSGEAAVKKFNQGLSSIESQAVKVSKGASKGLSAIEDTALSVTRSISGMTKEAATSGGRLQSLGRVLDGVFKPLRLAAYILPGLGLAGIIALFGDLLLSIIPIPDGLKRVFQSQEKLEKQANQLNVALREQIKTIEDYDRALEKLSRERKLIGLEGTDRIREELRAAKHDLESAQVELQGLMEHEERLFRVLYRGEEKAGIGARAIMSERWKQAYKEYFGIAFKADEDIEKYMERLSQSKTPGIQQQREEAEKKLLEVQNRAAELEEQLRKSQTRDVKEQVEHQRRILADVQRVEEEIAARRRQRVQEEQRFAFEAMKRVEDTYKKRTEYERQLDKQIQDYQKQQMQFEIDRAKVLRDEELRTLEMSGADRATIEAKRADIEIEYIRRVHDVKMALFDLETAQLIEQANLQREIIRSLGADTSQIDASINRLQAERDKIRAQMDEQTEAEIRAARENAAIRQYQTIRDENQKTFDSFKRSAEGVFDALVTKSSSVFASMGNMFKAAILTAIKEVITSRIALTLMSMFGGGGSPRMATAGAGGMLGTLGGVFMGGAGYGIPGMGGIGTPPFVPGGATTASGGYGGLLRLGGLLPGLKSFVGLGDKLIPNPLGLGTSSVPWSSLSLGGKLGAVAASPAAMLAGGLLFLGGAKRGGLLGLGMSVGGGALTGFGIGTMIGGPVGGAIGAAIGGGVGLISGLFGLGRKSPEKKMSETIQRMYGVRIADKGVLRQLVEMARPFGSFEMALRNSQIVDLIRLYADMTDQKMRGARAPITPVSLIQSGGSFFSQSGDTRSDVSVPSLGGVTTLGASRTSPIVVNITVPGAKEFFEKEAVQVIVKNPRAVQSATVAALNSNIGRHELTSLQLAPGSLRA